MNLTEGQLFTIEALNRIEGFVWPDNATHARVDRYADRFGDFLSFFRKDIKFDLVFICEFSLGASQLHNSARDSLITREQFDSVDGWVRNDGSKPVISGGFDLLLADGEAIYFCDIRVDRWDWSVPCKCGVEITHWRYHKPTKENEIQQGHPAALITDLLERYTKKRNERERLQTEIECLQTEKDRAKDDEDKLIEQIRQWHLQYGFDIRVLDESDEKPELEHEPELAITDWRDLRKGDEIECIKPACGAVCSGDIGIVTSVGSRMITADFIKQKGYVCEGANYGVKYKFIRRPSK